MPAPALDVLARHLAPGRLRGRAPGLRGCRHAAGRESLRRDRQGRAPRHLRRPCRCRPARPGGALALSALLRDDRRRQALRPRRRRHEGRARRDGRRRAPLREAARLRFRRPALLPRHRRRGGAGGERHAEAPEWAAARGEKFTAAIVGEPTSAKILGDQIKVGRRGSFSATLTVEGRQGHAAYPQDAENPVRGLTQLLYALQAEPLDAGSERFEPSSLEIVSVDVGNPAWNVIPASASARMNSRFNDRWTRATSRPRSNAASPSPPMMRRSAPRHRSAGR